MCWCVIKCMERPCYELNLMRTLGDIAQNSGIFKFAINEMLWSARMVLILTVIWLYNCEYIQTSNCGCECSPYSTIHSQTVQNHFSPPFNHIIPLLTNVKVTKNIFVVIKWLRRHSIYRILYFINVLDEIRKLWQEQQVIWISVQLKHLLCPYRWSNFERLRK